LISKTLTGFLISNEVAFIFELLVPLDLIPKKLLQNSVKHQTQVQIGASANYTKVKII